MVPLFLDRALLQARIGAAYECARKIPAGRSSEDRCDRFLLRRIDRLRAAPLRCRSERSGLFLHGVFANEREGIKAKTVPISPDAKGSLLILQGELDPLVTVADLQNVQKEMTKAGIDGRFTSMAIRCTLLPIRPPITRKMGRCIAREQPRGPGARCKISSERSLVNGLSKVTARFKVTPPQHDCTGGDHRLLLFPRNRLCAQTGGARCLSRLYFGRLHLLFDPSLSG